MKYLVLGCNGMVGHMVAVYLSERGNDVTGFAHKNSKYVRTIIGDAFNINYVAKIIEDGEYDAIINCIGILNRFAENDKKSAVFLNSFLPHFLVDITQKTHTQVIHISTDCVFSGKRGEYTEHDFRDGETFYDRSKALGEIEDEKNLTLRNSIIGPDLNPNGIGLLNWFLQAGEKVNGYVGAIWTGQTTLQLAKTIEEASKLRFHGLINAVPNNGISKYELLKLLNKYFCKNSIIINPVTTYSVNKSLKRTNFDFNYQIPDYEVMIAELYEWVRVHKDMYPHYKLK